MSRSSVCGILVVLGVFFITLGLVSAVHGRNIVEYNGQKLWTFELKNITKEVIQGGHTVRLFLEGTPLPKIYAYETTPKIWSHTDKLRYEKPRQTLPVTVTPFGMVEFNITNDQANPIALVVFHHRRGMHQMLLPIHNSISEQVLPHVELTIQGKPTFFKGTNVSLQLSIRITEGGTSVSWNYIWSDLYSRLSSSTNVLVPNTVELKYDKNEMTDAKAHLQINALSENAEGLLIIKSNIRYRCSKLCLLDSYVIEEQVPIYQEDHRGPFIDRFVGVPRLEATFGVDKQHCVYGSKFPCMVRCEFIGDHPKAVQLVRSGPEANLTPPILISSAVSDYWAEGWFQVEDLKLGVSKDFQCKAKSCHGETAFNISLTFIQRVTINKETSHLTSLDNGSVIVTCHAEGVPAPRLQLSDGFLFHGREYVENTTSATYDMKVTNRHNSSMAELHIPDKNTVTQGFIRCYALQGDSEEDAYFFFELREFSL